MGHLLLENGSGLLVATRLTQATGLPERAAAGMLIAVLPGRHRITVVPTALTIRELAAGPCALRACFDVFSLGAIGNHPFTGESPASSPLALPEKLQRHVGLRIPHIADGVGRDLDDLSQMSTAPEVKSDLGHPGVSGLSEQGGAGVSCRPHKGEGRPR